MASPATFDSLLREAARKHPRAIIAPHRMDFAGLDALADHYSARLCEALAREGDSAVLLSAPTAQSFGAVVGALRAGLALSLAPPEINGSELDAAILAANASIVAGPARFAGLPTGDLMCRVAVDQERVSLVAAHSGEISGALDLDRAREHETTFTPRSGDEQIRFVAGRNGPAARFDESELVSAADSIVRLARLQAGDVILTTLSMASPAGVAAGPLAALSAGARLVFHAPFDTRAFLASLDAAAPVHLVLPQALAPAFRAAGALGDNEVSSLIFSCSSPPGSSAFERAMGDPPIVSVAIGLRGGLRVEAVSPKEEPPQTEDAS